MKIKVRKAHQGGIIRLEGHGEVKEIIANTDILNPNSERIHVCFRGANTSGIIELSLKEAEHLSKSIAPLIKLKKNIKVLKLRE